MYAIVAGVSGNTRLQAKYKPEKLGLTSYQVTENKALIRTCTPFWLRPTLLYMHLRACDVIGSESLSLSGALLFLAAIPVSLSEPQCAFVFRAVRG